MAVGRKDWLFAGSERAGESCAFATSLIETAKAHGQEPLTYLTRAMRQLPMIAQELAMPVRATRHCSRFDSLPERPRAAQEWGAANAYHCRCRPMARWRDAPNL